LKNKHDKSKGYVERKKEIRITKRARTEALIKVWEGLEAERERYMLNKELSGERVSKRASEGCFDESQRYFVRVKRNS
jgi:hypothetical protein